MIENSTYQVYMAFKLLKITKLATINQSSFYIEEYLTEIYITRRIVLEVTLQYIRAFFQFVLLIHLFACAWIFVGSEEYEWMQGDVELYHENKLNTYVEGAYFITTTMTQVGYGDISAFLNSKLEEGTYSMIFTIVVQFFGLAGFSIIKNQVFSTRNEETLKNLIKKLQ